MRRAESSRPEVAEATSTLAERDVDVAFARDRLKPQLDLVAGYSRRGLAGSLNPNAPENGFLGAPMSCRTRSPADSAVRSERSARGAFPTRRSGFLSRTGLQPRSERGPRDRQISEEPGRDPPLATEAARRGRGAQRGPHARHRRPAHRRGEGREIRGRGAAPSREGALRRRPLDEFLRLTRQNDLALAVLTETPL